MELPINRIVKGQVGKEMMAMLPTLEHILRTMRTKRNIDIGTLDQNESFLANARDLYDGLKDDIRTEGDFFGFEEDVVGAIKMMADIWRGSGQSGEGSEKAKQWLERWHKKAVIDLSKKSYFGRTYTAENGDYKIHVTIHPQRDIFDVSEEIRGNLRPYTAPAGKFEVWDFVRTKNLDALLSYLDGLMNEKYGSNWKKEDIQEQVAEEWLERWHKRSSRYPERKPTMEDIEIRKEDIKDFASTYWKTLNLSDEELSAKMDKLEHDMGMAGKNWKDWYYKLEEMRKHYYNKTHSIKTAVREQTEIGGHKVGDRVKWNWGGPGKITGFTDESDCSCSDEAVGVNIDGEDGTKYNVGLSEIKEAQYSPGTVMTPRMQEHHKKMEKDMVKGPEPHTTLPQSKMEKDITKTPTGFHKADIVVTDDDITVLATGEADQDYDHEFYDKIVELLDAAEFPGATHREFDKYQGVYLNVPGVDKFWTRSVFVISEGIAYVMVPEKDMGGRGWYVLQFATKGTSGLEPTGEINASELIEYCQETRNQPSEKTKEWEERWHKKSSLKKAEILNFNRWSTDSLSTFVDNEGYEEEFRKLTGKTVEEYIDVQDETDVEMIEKLLFMRYPEKKFIVDYDDVSEMIQWYEIRESKQIHIPDIEKAKEWEERWHKKSELYPERYMGDPRGQMEMPGTVEIVNLTVIPGAKEIPTKAIDRLKPLPQYWYENEQGIKHIPTEEEMHGEPFFPKDFPIQHCLTPELIEEINYTDDRGHLMTGHKTINCIEDIVLYLVLQRGWKMTDAIVSAAETCERCLNILIEESGGEKYDQHEKDTCHTHCEQCAIVDPEYDKAFKQYDKEREMGMHHENDAHLIEENNTDLVKESSDKKKERIMAIEKKLLYRARLRKAQLEIAEGYFMPTIPYRLAQMPQEEFKTNQFIIFTQDCRFKMEQMDAMGEIKENMIGKVTKVTDDGILVEIGKQVYEIPYLDAFKVVEPFQAKVISPEQEVREQGGEEGKEGEELVPEEQPGGAGEGEEPAVTRPETSMERGPVPIRAPMKPLEKALQVETVLHTMMKRLAIDDPRKQLVKDTPVMVNGQPGKIVNFIGTDYQVRLNNGRIMIVPMEAISTQGTPQKPVQQVKTPPSPPKSVPERKETPQQPIAEDLPVGSDVWISIPQEKGNPWMTRGTIIKVQDGKYTIRRMGFKGEIVEADKSQITLISKPEKPKEQRVPYPPYRYSRRGLSPVYPKDNVPKNTFVYVEIEKDKTPLYFGRVTDEANNMLGVEVLAEERSDYFPRDQVFYVEMPLAVREQMMEKFKEWTTDTQATVLDRLVVADIINIERQEEKMDRVILGQIEISDQMLDEEGMWLSRELWEPKVRHISKEIESLLGQIERGINVTGQMSSYIEDLGEILEKIPHAQLIEAGEYLGKLWNEEGKKSPIAFISSYLEVRASNDMGKKPLKELNKIVKERHKSDLKQQKDDMKDGTASPREVSRDNVHQDINFQSRMSSIKTARKFEGGEEVELLTGIWKGQRGKIMEFNPGEVGRGKGTYRVRVGNDMLWKGEDEIGAIAKPEPVAVPTASPEFKGIVADISAGYKQLVSEIENSSNNPYVVSEIGKRLMKKEDKNHIAREGEVIR